MPFILQGFREFEESLGAASEYIGRAFANISASFSQIAEEVIEETFLQAAAQTGPEAFPPPYIPPMLEAARRIINISPGGIALDFEEMGTPQDLSEGYHYGAKIEGGGQVDLPWGGGNSDAGLKNEVEVRYDAWLKVFHGETWHGIDYSGSWAETIAARLDAWGDKAPQWLLLEYGQEEWEPTIEPLPIVETITTKLYGIFESMLREEVEQVIAELNKPIPKTSPSYTEKYMKQPRDAKGRFASYQPGWGFGLPPNKK